MPRQLKPEIKQLLCSRRWLYEQHVDNLMGINEIARKLQVTPAVVRSAIRKANIESPSQQKLREASNLRKYGVPNPGMVQDFRDKALDTMVKRFGGHNWSNNGNREQRDQTCVERYGNSNVGKTEYAREKAKRTNLERYGREHVNQTHITEDHYLNINSIEWLWDQHNNKQRTLSDIANECGVDMSILMNRLRRHGLETKHFFHSTGEKEMLHFVKNALPNVIVENNVRDIIPPYELDIYIPEYKLAIEYCGLYWHSSLFKPRTYHRDKFIECKRNGIRLLTIFEDEWKHKRSIVEQKILNILKISSVPTVYARKTQVVQISTDQKNKFLDKYHIQGTGSGSISYGLVHNNDLVAVMTFIKQQHTFVLNRYATSQNVPGGFSKILKHFQHNHEYTQIVSFADLRWSVGALYENTGWVVDSTLSPDYYWCKNGKRYHKFGFRHKHLPKKLTMYDANLSESENCARDGYTKVYNCGLIKYLLENDE